MAEARTCWRAGLSQCRKFPLLGQLELERPKDFAQCAIENLTSIPQWRSDSAALAGLVRISL